MARLPISILHQILPVAGRRLVVVDPGTRTLKVLVVEPRWGRLRILHRQTIDLEAENPDVPLDAPEQLTAALPELASAEMVLVLPQHRAISTLLDVPQETTETARFIESEVRKLSGLGEQAMFHGHRRLQPFARLRNPLFVTLCKREEIDAFIERFVPALEGASEPAAGAELADIVATGQAMFAAVSAGTRPPSHAVVVDLGADNTVVGIVLNGQGVHATSFDGGSSRFTAALATERGCDWPTAETLKRTEDVLASATPSPACTQAVDQWYADLQRAVVEWMDDYPELGVAWQSLPVCLCGGGASQPGLVDYLNRLGGLRFQPWPASAEVDPDLAMDQYWVAYGAARAALGQSGPTVSLLPPELGVLGRRRRWWEWLQAANVLLLTLLAGLLGLFTWQEQKLLQEKEQLIRQTSGALQSAATVVQLADRLDAGYAGLRPVLRRQQRSLETLAALAAIRQVRTNNDFWLVLFADAASYAAAPTLPPPTNATSTPLPAPAPSGASAPLEFVAELCVPQEGDATRRILSQVVADLKQHPVFGRVDALPPERKRAVVDPRVIISNRVFALSMEIASAQTNRALETILRAGSAGEARRSSNGSRPRDERGSAATNAGGF